MAVVLGVDSSTQSVKVEARDVESGQVLATGSARHPATQPPVSEQDPESWWQALVEATAQLEDLRSDVVAISVAGQQHGCGLIGDKGQSVRPAKLWNDTTSAPHAAALVKSLGAQAWAEATGSVPVASFTITKLAWMAEHEPALLDQVSKVMLPHDYLTWRLTGSHVTDRGDASGTGWYSPRTGSYLPDLLSLATGQDGDAWLGKLPTVLGLGEPAGELTADAANVLGLPVGTIIGSGTGDNMGAALGLGLGSGDVAVSLGTSGTIYGVSPTPTNDVTGAVAGFADASGGFLPLVATLNATKVTDTVARWLGTDAPGLASLATNALGLGSGSDAAGPLLVPHFDGERSPNLPTATGTFIGLRNSTTREDLALAAHDGVLCGLLGGLDALRQAGAQVEGRVHLIGGGAKSVAYQQRCADLLGQSVRVPKSDETVATGAAAQAAGLVSSLNAEERKERWGLGQGIDVVPKNDASAIRERYRSLRFEA